MNTPGSRIAAISGANTGIIAVKRGAGLADTTGTDFITVAGVPVSAGGIIGHRRIHTTGYRIATVIGAGVAIITISGLIDIHAS